MKKAPAFLILALMFAVVALSILPTAKNNNAYAVAADAVVTRKPGETYIDEDVATTEFTPEDPADSRLTTTTTPANITAARGTCGENISWTLEDGIMTVVGSGKMENMLLTYPSGSYFYLCKDSIKKLVIDEGIAVLSSHFAYCKNLSTVSLPSTLLEFDGNVFCGCCNLTEIAIPSKIKSISVAAFANCVSLEKVTIPKSVTIIENQAFDGCCSLKDVFYLGTQSEWNSVVIEHRNVEVLTATLHTIENVSAVILNKTEVRLMPGYTVALNAEIIPNNATYKTEMWHSSNESIATVDKQGNVTAISNGVTTITVTLDNGISAECIVTVDDGKESSNFLSILLNSIKNFFDGVIAFFSNLF